jgi:hypothetical protein
MGCFSTFVATVVCCDARAKNMLSGKIHRQATLKPFLVMPR